MKNTLGVNLRAKPAIFSREKYHFLCNFYLSHFSGQFITKSVRAPLVLYTGMVCAVVMSPSMQLSDRGQHGIMLICKLDPVDPHFYIIITKTRTCNTLRFFKALKIIILR